MHLILIIFSKAIPLFSLRLLHYSPSGRHQLAGLVVGNILTTLTYVVQGVLVARFLAQILRGEPNVATTLIILGLITIVVAVRQGLFYLVNLRGIALAAQVKATLRQELIDTLINAEPGRVLIDDSGKTQTTLVDSVERLESYLARFVPQAWATTIGFLGICVYVITIDPLVGSIILMSGLAGPAVLWYARGYWNTNGKAWWQRYYRMYAEILDVIRGMSTLKTFNATQRKGDQLYAGAQAFCRESIRVNTAEGVFIGILSLLAGIGTAVAVGVGAARLVGGHISGEQLVLLLILAGEAFRPLRELDKAYHASYAAWPAGKTIFEVLDKDRFAPASEFVPSSALGPLATPPRSDAIAITFDQISFAYPTEPEHAVLNGVSIPIEAGERIAIVGRSGSGKSTLVALLLRFFDPDSGDILLNDVPISSLPKNQLRSLISVVTQDTYLFHDTVRNNLLLANPDASPETLTHALEVANALAFVSDLPQGLDTIVGERGLRLSGGQRQRLSIARAVLKDAPILVLDEATSSIDTINEADINRALTELSAGRTTLVIAHRLSTVKDADRIVVMESGRVIQIGQPADLQADHGLFHQLLDAEDTA